MFIIAAISPGRITSLIPAEAISHKPHIQPAAARDERCGAGDTHQGQGRGQGEFCAIIAAISPGRITSLIPAEAISIYIPSVRFLSSSIATDEPKITDVSATILGRLTSGFVTERAKDIFKYAVVKQQPLLIIVYDYLHCFPFRYL